MSITKNAQKKLSSEEQEKLAILLAELQNRGLEIPQEMKQNRKLIWPVDSRGYFRKLDGSPYNPTEYQEKFCQSSGIFVGFWGSRGSGKSSAGAQKALKKISQGQNGIIANADFENLKISTWPEFREWCPWEMVVPKHRYRSNPEWQPTQPFVLAFRNGVRVIVKGIKDPHSARGPNVNWFWFDEAQRTDEALAWQTAIASVRIGKNPQSFATFTPNGVGHWTTELFVEKEIPEEAIKLLDALGKDRKMVEDFHGTLFDNMDNLSPEFSASILAAYPAGWLREQEVYGKVVKREGALGDPSWFDGKVIPKVPDTNIKKRVRFWDLAATEKEVGKRKKNDPDKTVGTRMSWDSKYFYGEDQVGGYWEWDDVLETIYRTAIIDGPHTKIIVEQEPGAGGKLVIAAIKNYLREKLPGHPTVKGWLPKSAGDKVMRANTWFAEAKEGIIFLVAGDWNKDFFDELGSFNFAPHDDHIDSFSGARHNVAPVRKWSRSKFLHV